MSRLLHRISVMLLSTLLVYTAETDVVLGQENVTNDWKVTQVGKIRQLLQNRGRGGYGGNYSGYTGLIDSEYPPGSGNESVKYNHFMIGGYIPLKFDPVISMGMGYASPDAFWATEAHWDTIWVVNKGDTVDIGGYKKDGTPDFYWPNYTAVSDQDFVCRFNDYLIPNPTIGGSQRGMHDPMFLEVIQVVYSWSSPPLDEILIFTWHFIPTKFELQDVYFLHHVNFCIGLANRNASSDDVRLWFEDEYMHGAYDTPGGEDGTAHAVAFKLFPPDGYTQGELNWSYILTELTWGPVDHDPTFYREIMSSGWIMEDQKPDGWINPSNHNYYSYGPFDIQPGDTLTVRMAEIMAPDIKTLEEHAMVAAGAATRVPSAPPIPPMQAEVQNREVLLSWAPTESVNPEIFIDPARADSDYVDQPFEGYRVYKSAISKDGPWTKLAEFDVPGNNYGHNTGLQYEYRDEGLLNNVEYYYSVTAFSKPDTVYPWPSMETSVTQNAKTIVPGTPPPASVGNVVVVPNPYRGDETYYQYNPPWEQAPTGRTWMEQDRRIQFINLPEQCTIKVYTAAGDFVAEIHHVDPNRGYEDWNLTSYVNQAIASGLYLFTVEDTQTGNKEVGKFVIIK